MARHFPCLDILEINDCFQIEKVFDFNDDEHGEKEVLQNLKTVNFKSLPNLTQIHRGFKLQHHVKREIVDYPKCFPSYQIPTQTE